MTFTLEDALAFLRCPRTGAVLSRQGENLVGPGGERYPIVDGIADLTLRDAADREPKSHYDAIAGLAYNLWILNPAAMAFTWGLGVLEVPLRVRPARELGPGVFLEVPCGTGIFTARAYRKSPATRILAVDFSLGMLRAAAERAKRLGVDNAVFVRADVAHLPLAEASLDGCISLAGFHAFPDPKAAAAELGRVLKPRGVLTATIACSGQRRISDLMIEHVMKPGGYFSQALPVQTYRAYFEQAGFLPLQVDMAGAVAIVRGTKA